MPKPNLAEPTAAEVRAFGDLAVDVAYLRRGCGLLVAPFKEGWRIGREVVDADGLQARATKERARRGVGLAKVLPPLMSPGPVEPSPAAPDLCGCGEPSSHPGRCWARRGWAGPGQNPKRQSTIAERLSALEADVAALKRAASSEGGR